MKQRREPDSITLVPKYLSGKRPLGGFKGGLLVLGVVVIVPLVILAQLVLLDAITPETAFDPGAWKAIGQKLWESLWDDPVEAWLMLLVVIVAPAAVWIKGEPRLLISASGIGMTGARKDRLLGRNLNWSMKAAEIKSIKLEDSAILSTGAVLSIRSRNGRSVRIGLAQWVESNAARRPFLKKGVPLFSGPKRLREDNLESPLVKTLQRFDYSIDIAAPYASDGALGFDLTKSPIASISVAVIFALIMYAVIGLVVPSESYVAGYPFVLFAFVGIGVGTGVGIANLLGDVPRTIAIGLAIVAGTVGAAAAYPGLLRINAGMDQIGMQSVLYVHKKGYEYRARDGDWPNIKVPEKVHWGRVDSNEAISVPIRRGALGFYQADFRHLIH